MSNADYGEDPTSYSNSNHRNTFVEEDFLVHLRKPRFSAQNIVDDNQIQADDEENFTDLRSCVVPLETNSDSSRPSSPFDVNNEKSKPIISYSLSLKQNHIRSNEDDDIPENNIYQQVTDTSSLEPYHLKSFDDVLHLISRDPYKFIFTPIPRQNNNCRQCRLVRDKSGLSQTFYLEVELENEEKPVCLLIAEKATKMTGPSQYLILLNPKFNKNLCSAELIGNNSTGTSYTLYVVNEDQRHELAIILYESNFLGLNGPRKVEVLLPKFNHQTQALMKDNDTSEDYFEEQNDSYIHLNNKKPIWDEESYCHVLRFEGKNRVTIPSVKNFQMVIENNKDVEQVVMQFGRMYENVFSCDFRYPLSFVQAFAIGLSAFETRLFRD